jgi:putative serine protease PepD
MVRSLVRHSGTDAVSPEEPCTAGMCIRRTADSRLSFRPVTPRPLPQWAVLLVGISWLLVLGAGGLWFAHQSWSGTTGRSENQQQRAAGAYWDGFSTGAPAGWADTYARVVAGVVLISNDYRVPLGAGFVFDESHVVTNAHVVDGASSVCISIFENADRHLVRVKRAAVRDVDRQLDLAVLHLDGPISSPLLVGSELQSRVGDEVMTIGDPRGLAWTASFGRISAIRRGQDMGEPHWRSLLQFDASTNPGNSGGPLFNQSGLVIGLVTFSFLGDEGLHFAVSGDQLWERVVDLIAAEEPPLEPAMTIVGQVQCEYIPSPIGPPR